MAKEKITVKVEMVFEEEVDAVKADPVGIVKKHLKEGVKCNGEVYFPMHINPEELEEDGHELNIDYALDGQTITLKD